MSLASCFYTVVHTAGDAAVRSFSWATGEQRLEACGVTTLHFTVSKEINRQLQEWLAQQDTAPLAIDVARWLLERNDTKREHARGPALIETGSDGSRAEKWYTNGKLDRKGGPAIIAIWPDGYRCEAWYSAGELHRDDGPAIIETQPDGARTGRWYENGKFLKKQTLAKPDANQGVTSLPPKP